MEKGKKPIQEEEDLLSFYEYQLNVSSSPLPPPFSPAFSATYGESVESSGSGSVSAKESVALDEIMDDAQVDFFSKFLSMDYSDSTNIDQSPVLPTSNSAPVPIVQLADNALGHVSPETTVKPKARSSGGKLQPNEFRKSVSPQMLANLARVDPKRAKRIVTNRMSAVRAKEKKKLYIFMLEHKVHTLQTESASFSNRLSLLQAEGNCLNEENKQLNEHMELILQQIHIQDALNNDVRKEIHHLRILTGRNCLTGETLINSTASSRNNNNRAIASSGNNNSAMNATFATQQFPALQDQNPCQQQLWYGLQQQHQGQHPYQVQHSNQHQQLQQQNLQQTNYQIQNEQVQPESASTETLVWNSTAASMATSLSSSTLQSAPAAATPESAATELSNAK